MPVELSVFSPRAGDSAGRDGAGFVVDVSLTARTKAANRLLSSEAGYKPFFNNPTAPTFQPGANGGAPGLVVMLSTTPTTPGTPFQGPGTNLAGLFQINGVGTREGRPGPDVEHVADRQGRVRVWSCDADRVRRRGHRAGGGARHRARGDLEPGDGAVHDHRADPGRGGRRRERDGEGRQGRPARRHPRRHLRAHPLPVREGPGHHRARAPARARARGRRSGPTPRRPVPGSTVRRSDPSTAR